MPINISISEAEPQVGPNDNRPDLDALIYFRVHVPPFSL